jgi:TrmH family RNA methyltransferase
MISKNEVKYIRSLGQQKGRDESGTFLAEGAKLVRDLIMACPENVQKVIAVDAFIRANEDILNGIPTEQIDEETLHRISLLSTPNQVVAVIRKYQTNISDIPTKGWVLALDGIQDPGNAGTIIRTADWFGIRHIVCSPDCVDLYNPKVVQASMGSIASVQVHRTDLLEWLMNYKGDVYGAFMKGEKVSHEVLPSYGVMVIGREGSGIRDYIKKYIRYPITIPGYGQAESLNAAVATGIILWEMMKK